MVPRETSQFCFPSSPDVSLDFVSGNTRTLGKTELTVYLGTIHYVYSVQSMLYRHIGLLFGKGLDTNLLRQRIRKYPDTPVHTLSDSLRIYFCHSGEWI